MSRTTLSTRTGHSPRTSWRQPRSLPFKAPALDKVDLSGRDVDAKTDAAVQASYLDAARLLEDQIRGP